MTTRWQIVVAWVATTQLGCHVVTGFDDLTLRDGAEHVWSAGFGDEPAQRIDDVVLSPGLLRVAGTLEGTVLLGDTELVAEIGTPRRFLAQADANGQFDWAISLDPAIVHRGLVPDTGRMTISYEEEVTVGDLVLPAPTATALSVVEIAPDGASFDRVFGGTATDLGAVHVVQVPGEPKSLVAAVQYSGTLTIGEDGECSPLTADDQLTGAHDIAIARIESRECVWLTSFGDPQAQWVDAVAADRVGNIFVAGRFQGEINFGGKNLVARGGTEYFVAKLSQDGEHLWSHRFGDVDRDQRPIQMVVRSSGTVTIAGYFSGNVDFGNGTQTSSLGHDIFVTKLDPSGTTVWVRHVNVRNDPVGDAGDVLTNLSLGLDGTGNTIIAGHFRGPIDFGGTAHNSDGALDMFLAKLDVDGRLSWSDSFGAGGPQCQFVDCVTAIAVDDNDDVILGGAFEGNMNLGGEDLQAVGESDAFLAKFRR